MGGQEIATLIAAVAEIEATVSDFSFAAQRICICIAHAARPSFFFANFAECMSQVLAPALDLLIKYFGNIVRTRFISFLSAPLANVFHHIVADPHPCPLTAFAQVDNPHEPKFRRIKK